MASTATNNQADATASSISRRRDLIPPLIVALATALFVAVAWFANATISDTSYTRTRNFIKTALHVDVGDTLTILSVLQGLLAFLMGMMLDSILELIQWSLMGRKQGLDLLSILALSPSTGVSGTLGILLCRTSGLQDRLWAFCKYVHLPIA
jgi:hypothetical protein